MEVKLPEVAVDLPITAVKLLVYFNCYNQKTTLRAFISYISYIIVIIITIVIIVIIYFFCFVNF